MAIGAAVQFGLILTTTWFLIPLKIYFISTRLIKPIITASTFLFLPMCQLAFTACGLLPAGEPTATLLAATAMAPAARISMETLMILLSASMHLQQTFLIYRIPLP